MPPAVGIIVAPFRRHRDDCCLHQCACSGWLASVGSVLPSQRRADRAFLRDYIAQSGQMHPGDRESQQTTRAQNAHHCPTGTATAARPGLDFKAFPGSLPLRTRATGVVLGALS